MWSGFSYELLDRVAQVSGGMVYSTGGASRSDIWMQLRADVCQRTVHRPACPEAAMGAAILAATGTRFASVQQAAAGMTRMQASFAPERNLDDIYQQFVRNLTTWRS